MEWFLVPAIAIFAFVCVLMGDGKLDPNDWFQAVNAFTRGFPSEYDKDRPWVTLGLALASLVALYATLRLVTVLFAQRIREWRVRRWFSGHTVVVGVGETGLRAVRWHRGKKRRVVAVTQEPFGPAAETVLRERAWVVSGSGTDSATLGGAGVAKAAAVVCAEADDVVNVQIALDVLGAARTAEREPPRIEAEASEASAATAMLKAMAHGSVTLFSLRELWAWRLLETGPLWPYRASDEKPPHVVVLGAGGIAQALLACVCRWWHFDAGGERSGERLPLIVFDRGAQAVCADLARRHPELRETVDLRALEVDFAEAPDDVVDATGRDGRPWVAYVCLDASDVIRRAAARVARRRLAAEPNGKVVVAVSTVSTEDESASDATPPIVPVVPSDPWHGFDPEKLGRVERLARSIHGVYERHVRETGEVDVPALKPFDHIDAQYQASNRAHAAAIGGQLLAVLKTTDALRDWSSVRTLTPVEVEVMSELEHIRWCAEKVGDGWTHGEPRDDKLRRHPDLVPWPELEEKSQNKNRNFMRKRPWTLARIGEAIVLHPARERLAQLTHDAYRERVDPASPSWDDLSEALRASNRAFVDDIPAKLLAVGRRIAEPSEAPPAPPLRVTEVEDLARREHERWMAFQSGPHPDLVPWDELSEEKREIDRVLVRAIPRLIQEVGLAAVLLGEPVPSRLGESDT